MKTIFKTISVSFVLCLFYASAFSQQTAEEFYDKGVEMMKSGKYVEAIPLFDEALNLNSSYTEALLERSRAKSNNQRDLKGAFADVESALLLNPKYGEAYFERARLRNSMLIKKVKEKGSMSEEEILPFFKAILEDVNLAIENGFKNKRSYTYRAELQSRHFDNQTDAIKDYTVALTYDADDSQLLISRSHAKRNNDDFQGSIDDLREVIRRYDEAKKDNKISVQKLASLKSAAVMALVNLSSDYGMIEKPDLQLWAIEKSIELQPTAIAYIALARHKMIFGDLDESISAYTKAIEMSGEKSGLYFIDRGIVYTLQGKLAEAEADFEQGKKIQPNLKNYNLKYSLELARRQREQKKVRVELPK